MLRGGSNNFERVSALTYSADEILWSQLILTQDFASQYGDISIDVESFRLPLWLPSILMPKPPNLSSPVAAIRHKLGMKLPDFAEFIGHGTAMLKQIEAGRKPMSDELRDKIHAVTAVPYKLLTKDRWTSADRSSFTLTPLSVTAMAGPSPNGLTTEPLRLLSSIIAAYYTLLQAGIQPRLALIPLEREITRTLKRWGAENAEFFARYEDYQFEIERALWGDGHNDSLRFFEKIQDQLSATKPIVEARKRSRDWMSSMMAANLQGAKEVNRNFDAQIERARKRSNRSPK